MVFIRWWYLAWLIQAKHTTMKEIILLSALLMITLLIQAQLIRVPNDHSSIQAAIDASFDGDTVLGVMFTHFIIRHDVVPTGLLCWQDCILTRPVWVLWWAQIWGFQGKQRVSEKNRLFWIPYRIIIILNFLLGDRFWFNSIAIGHVFCIFIHIK